MLDRKMNEKIDKLNNNLEKFTISEWAYILGSRKEIFKKNFLAGISRGLGMTVGVTIVTAILIYFLQNIVKMNLPLIGDYIKDIVEIVENRK